MATVLYDELDFCDIVTNEKEALILHFKENSEEMIGLLGSNLSISDIAMKNACHFMAGCLENAEETLHKIFDGKAAVFSYYSKSWNSSRNGFCINDFFVIYKGLKNAKGNPARIEIINNAVYIEFPDHDGGEFITVKVINTNDDYYKGVLSSGLSLEKVKKHIYNYCTCAIPSGIAE